MISSLPPTCDGFLWREAFHSPVSVVCQKGRSSLRLAALPLNCSFFVHLHSKCSHMERFLAWDHRTASGKLQLMYQTQVVFTFRGATGFFPITSKPHSANAQKENYSLFINSCYLVKAVNKVLCSLTNPVYFIVFCQKLQRIYCLVFPGETWTERKQRQWIKNLKSDEVCTHLFWK